MKTIGRVSSAASLLVLGMLAMAMLVPKPLRAEGPGLYWLCQVTSPSSGWCPVSEANPLPTTASVSITSVTANQGTPALIANAWPIYVSQGGAVLSAGNPLFTQLTAGAAVIGAVTQSGTWTQAQGNAGSNAQAWWTRLGDGTNGPAAVKPASTAPVATDSALVVTLSPNSAAQAPSATSASGGVANFARLTSSASGTNLTAVKASAARVYKIVGCNTTSSYIYAKFYNLASGSVTVGSSTVLFSRPFPPNQCASYDLSDIGWSFSTAASFALTGGTADSDTTSIGSGAMTQVSVEYN